MWLSCDAGITRVQDELRWAVSNLAAVQAEAAVQEQHHVTVLSVAVIPWAQHHHALMFQTLRGVMWSACSPSALPALGGHGSGLQAATQHGRTVHYMQHTHVEACKPSLFKCTICAGMQAQSVLACKHPWHGPCTPASTCRASCCYCWVQSTWLTGRTPP